MTKMAAMLIYGKTFKNLLLQNRGCLVAESLLKSSGIGGLPKLLKWWLYIAVWPFYCKVKFASLCICIGTIYLYGKKSWEIQTTSSLEPLGQYCSNFIWSLLRLGEQKIDKMVMAHRPGWLPCTYMIKTFKNLLFQNQTSPGALSLHKSSGMGGLPKLLKWWSYVDVWPFYGKVKFASPCICMVRIHL